MKTLNKKILAMIALVLGSASVAGSASAEDCNLQRGGFLAALTKCVVPAAAPIADAADQLNGQLGRPVDHAVAAAADGLVPGAGTAIEASWEVQRSGMLDGGFSQRAPQPMGQPMMQPVMQPQFAGMPMPQLGNVCYTPMGPFGPGPVNPIGAPCYVMTPYGPVMGNVGR